MGKKRIFFGILMIMFFFALLPGFFNGSKNDGGLEGAVYLEEPKIKPENEGKVVIISGKADIIENAYDNEMGLHFKYPVVLRRKEIRKEERIDDKDKVETKWHLAPKGDTKFFGTIKLGDFKISNRFLNKLPYNGKNLDKKDFDPNELKNLPSGFYVYAPIFKFYIENGNSIGDIRMQYSLGYNGPLIMTLAGIQKNGVLEYSDNISYSFFEKKMTYKEMIKKGELSTFLTFGFTLLIALIGLALLISGIRSYRKYH